MCCRRSVARPRAGHRGVSCRAPSTREWSSPDERRARSRPRPRRRCARAWSFGGGWSRGEEQRCDGGDEAGELLRLGAQLAAPLISDLVELCLAAELRGAPVGLDPAVSFPAIERGIERPLFDTLCVARLFPLPTHDCIAMARAEGERL